ncbi:MAG: hypothetical protein V4610_07465 [Pseudomonadota bacterium]
MNDFERARNRIYDRIHQRLQAVARAFTATSSYPILSEPNDLAQTAMLKVHEFITRRELFLGDEFILDQTMEREAMSWGTTCLKHSLIDEIRAVRLRLPRATRPKTADGEEDPPDETPSMEPSAEENVCATTLLKALRTLKSRHREKYVEGLETMLRSVSDSNFTRATLGHITDLTHTQLGRIESEIVRSGIADRSSAKDENDET